MSNMVKLLCFAIVLFSVAASASWYLQYQQQNATPEDPAATAHGSASHGGEKSHGGGHGAPSTPAPKTAKTAKSAEETSAPRPLPRPATTAETDRIAQMAATLQQQKDTLIKREEALGVREKQMEIVHLEILKEQKKLDSVRKEISQELQLVSEKLELAEKRLALGDKERLKIEAQKEDVQNAVVQIGNLEQKNMKQLATIYDKMDPEAASQAVQQMVDSGKLDMAVGILANMRERQAASLLGDIAKQDPDMAVRLFDRMRVVKGPSAKGKE